MALCSLIPFHLRVHVLQEALSRSGAAPLADLSHIATAAIAAAVDRSAGTTAAADTHDGCAVGDELALPPEGGCAGALGPAGPLGDAEALSTA